MLLKLILYNISTVAVRSILLKAVPTVETNHQCNSIFLFRRSCCLNQTFITRINLFYEFTPKPARKAFFKTLRFLHRVVPMHLVPMLSCCFPNCLLVLLHGLTESVIHRTLKFVFNYQYPIFVVIWNLRCFIVLVADSNGVRHGSWLPYSCVAFSSIL